MNEDLANLIMLVKTIFGEEKESRISITIVDESTPPQYPKYCDVINAWCFSKHTPRCPYQLQDILLSKWNKDTKE